MSHARSFRRLAATTASVLAASGLMLGVALSLGSSPAHAAAGTLNITVTREGGFGALVGATVAVECDGGTWQDIGVTNGSGVATTNVSTLFDDGALANCEDGETVTARATMSGYVQKASVGQVYDADPEEVTISNVLFADKFTLDDEMVENNLVSDATVSISAGPTTCVSSGSTYYCAAPPGTGNVTITVGKDGYVIQSFFMDADRVDDTSAQVGHTGEVNLEHAMKVAVTTELEGPLTGATVQSGDGAFISCNEDGSLGIYYCAIPLDDTITNILVAKAGYVQKTVNSAWTDRDSDGDLQQVADPITVKFSHRVYVEREGDEDTLDGATVTAGTAHTACVGGGSGYYYCPVPVAQDGTGSVSVTKTGYVTNSSAASLDNRTIATDPQAYATTTRIDFQLRVNVADQLGTDVSGTVTYDGNASDASNANSYYFARQLSNVAVEVTKSGFVNSGAINAVLADVSTSPAGQTTITLGSGSANNDAAISAGESVSVRGLEYKAKSAILRTQQTSGLISDIAGYSYSSSMDPTDDISFSSSNGATVHGSAVSGDVIYLAVTGDGGGDDTFSIRLSNVTADGGAADGANFVTRDFVDVDNVIATGPTLPQKTFSANTSEGDPVPDIDGRGFPYPLGVTIADELGNDIDASVLSTITFNGVAPYFTVGTSVLFTNTHAGGALVINAPGFAQNGETNSGFSSVTIDQTTSTFVLLGANPAASTITLGMMNNVKGLSYAIKSNLLRSEVGGDVTSIANSTGYILSSTPSADVTLGGSNGLSIIGSAVAGNVIYIAATGDGATGGADTFTVQLQNVLADGGVDNEANFVKATLVDDGNQLSTATSQLTFDVATTESSESFYTSGFLYPLKVNLADQLGNAISNSSFATKTFNGASAYYASGSTLYWAQTGSHALALAANGFVPSANTNGGFSAVAPTQNAQTTINLGNSSSAEGITADTENNIKGLEYALRSGTMQSELNESIYNIAGTEGYVACEGDPCAISSDILAAADGGTGAALLGGAISGDVVYLAVTGDGATGGDDIFFIYPHGVTVGSGDADSADMTTVAFTDTDHTVNTNTTQGVMNAGPEVGVGSLNDTSGYRYPLVVNLADEIGNDVDVSGLSAATYNGVSPYRTSTNSAYFAHHGSSAALVLHRSGYVANETTNTGYSDISTDATAGQIIITMGDYSARTLAITAGSSVSVRGFVYGMKVTVQREGDYSAVSGSTVRAGGSYATLCDEDGSTGVHYCAVPLSDTATSTRIVNSAFNTKYLNYTDRTADSDGQRTLTAILVSPGDITAPTVLSQTPVDSSTDVPVSVSPTITFDEAMDPATLNGGTVKIKKSSDDSDVTATILYNPSLHKVILDPDTDLLPETSYYLWISGARDVSGNILATDYSSEAATDHDFVTVAASTLDVTSPTISDIAVSSITSSTVAVTWTTDETSTSTVQYGLTSSYGSTSSSNTGVTSHTIYLTGLTANTVYHFRVKSTDVSGNMSTSVDGVFTTALDDTSAVLSVTGIATTNGYAVADNSFTNGWKWTFHVTVPTNEDAFRMKFADLVSGSNSIAASNIRIYSPQSSNATSTSPISISGADTYSDYLYLTSDRDAGTAGRQIQVIVQTRVPVSSAGGSYSTNYGISSTESL